MNKHIFRETITTDKPFVDEGEGYIRNLLILGKKSKNPIDLTNPRSPKRNYIKITSDPVQYAKFEAKVSYILHEDQHTDNDTLGTFHNVKSSPKGLRADLKYVLNNPQVEALIDNIKNERPFGGFSPTMVVTESQINMDTGEVLGIESVDSIDLVANPGTVKSITEEEEEPKEYASKEEHNKLREEHDELKRMCEDLLSSHKELKECFDNHTHEMVKEKVKEETYIRTEPIPDVPSETETINIFDFVRK